jgi:hypothetical protein
MLHFRPPEQLSPKRQSDTELIMARLAEMPTRQNLWRAAVIGMLGGGCFVECLALLFR